MGKRKIRCFQIPGIKKICSICEYESSSLRGIKLHFRYSHNQEYVEEVKVDYACQTCKFVFETKRELNQHAQRNRGCR